MSALFSALTLADQRYEQLEPLSGTSKYVMDKHGSWSWRDQTHYRFGDWREQERCNMLHLKDSMRMKMGRWVEKFFRMETGNFIQPSNN